MIWNAGQQRATGKSESSLWTEQEETNDLQSIIPQREEELEKIVRFISERFQSQPDAIKNAIDSVEQGFWPLWERVTKLGPDTLRYLALKNIKKEIKDS